MYGVGTVTKGSKRNSNKKSHLYHHVSATEHGIYKGKFRAVIYTLPINLKLNNGTDWLTL